MTTNVSIKKGTPLYNKAQDLLNCAYEYWKEYRKLGDPSAVVFIESNDGHFILFK
jgi:hypothetical protein